MMLASALNNHEGALRASLQSEYWVRLLPSGRTEPERTLFEVADLVKYLPLGCALGREVGGVGALSDEAHMAREIHYALLMLMYQNAGNEGAPPKRMELPKSADEQQRETIQNNAKLAAFLAREARRTVN